MPFGLLTFEDPRKRLQGQGRTNPLAVLNGNELAILAQGWVPKKWLNRSRCHLGLTRGSEEPFIRCHSKSEESIYHRKWWQNSDAAFCQIFLANSLTTCFSGLFTKMVTEMLCIVLSCKFIFWGMHSVSAYFILSEVRITEKIRVN